MKNKYSFEIEPLKEKLKDWTDLDVAAYHLAINLGIMSPDVEFATDAKHVFWTKHIIGDKLYDFLFKLIDLHILEFRTNDKRIDNEKVRWNAEFKGSWETKMQRGKQ